MSPLSSLLLLFLSASAIKKLSNINLRTPLPRLLIGISSPVMETFLKTSDHFSSVASGISGFNIFAIAGSILFSLSTVESATFFSSARTFSEISSNSFCSSSFFRIRLVASFRGSCTSASPSLFCRSDWNSTKVGRALYIPPQIFLASSLSTGISQIFSFRSFEKWLQIDFLIILLVALLSHSMFKFCNIFLRSVIFLAKRSEQLSLLGCFATIYVFFNFPFSE